MVCAPIVLGAGAGWVTGITKADSTVVAAVLPAILTGAGGALLAFKLRKDHGEWLSELVNTCGAVIVFTLALVAAMHGGLTYKEAGEDRERARERKQFAIDLDFRRKSLLRCSWNEAQVNATRKAAELAPLPAEVFCDIGPVYSR